MLVRGETEVAQSCPTLWDPMDCSLPGFSVHGIFQATVLEWVASQRQPVLNLLKALKSDMNTKIQIKYDLGSYILRGNG